MANHVPKNAAKSRLSSPDAVVVGRSMAAITEMTILDDHWTRTAIAISNGDVSNDVDTLGDVVAELDRLLDASRPGFGKLAEVFRAHADEMNATYQDVLGGKSTGQLALDEDGRKRLRGAVDMHGKGNIAIMAADAAQRLSGVARVASERQAINAEFAKLKAGKTSDGDLSDDQWLDIGLIAAGMSVVLGPEAGVVVAGIGALLDFLGF